MAVHNIYIDIDRSVVVLSPTDSSIAPLPPFIQDDTLNLRVWLLTDFSRTAAYTKIPVAGITLQVAIGTKSGNTTLYYTQQFTWVPSTDLGQPYFAAQLPMNTAGITALLGAGAAAQAWFEVKMIQSALPVSVLSQSITVQAAVIKAGGVPVPAGLTPMSVEAAYAAFLTRNITGQIPLTN